MLEPEHGRIADAALVQSAVVGAVQILRGPIVIRATHSSNDTPNDMKWLATVCQ
jgi:DUF1680 family protein